MHIFHRWEYFRTGRNTRTDAEGHVVLVWYDNECRQCSKCGKHQTPGYDGWM